MIATALDATVMGVLLALIGPPAPPPTGSATETPGDPGDAICLPLKELEPKASRGGLGRAPSKLSDTGWLTRWSAAAGDTLRLKVRPPEAGTYVISIRAVPATDGPALSARLWEVPLTREGQVRFMLQGPSPDRLLDIGLDPAPMGPGYHVLELECVEAGDILLDCVGLRRTGDAPPEIGQPAGEVEERPFLGVQLGRARPEGVPITRTIPDTAADGAGLAAGDVLVTLDGVVMSSLEQVQDAIASHRPGDRLELELLRDGERITMAVELGRRPEMLDERRERTEHVIEVLQVRPGQVIADVGCGSGWLAEAIAAALGADGTVYAVEIQDRLVGRLHRWSNPNVVPVLSTPRDVCLPEACLDTAVLHDVASHVARRARPRFYQSLERALKPEGQLVIFGPHGEAATMLRELRRFGFIPVNDDAFGGLSPEELDQQLRDGIVFRRQ
jgi:SAM-dependent methyltransferase